MNERLRFFTEDEWEMLCDNCGLCCLYKLQDADTGEILYTSVVCPLLVKDTRRCSCYTERFEKMPTCTKISPESLPEIAHWLPKSCAYRCLFEGISLPDWHPLNADESPEGKDLLKKVSEICIRPNTCLTKEKAERIIQGSKAPRNYRKLNRLLFENVIEDPDL